MSNKRANKTSKSAERLAESERITAAAAKTKKRKTIFARIVGGIVAAAMLIPLALNVFTII